MGEVGIVHDRRAETLEDGNRGVEGEDFGQVGCCLVDCGAGDADFGTDQGVKFTCCGVVWDRAIGEGDCRSIVVLSSSDSSDKMGIR